jgi:hypothetical protein
VWVSCPSLSKIQDLGQHVPKTRRSWESEGGQSIEPNSQNRAWLDLLTSWTSEETQRDNNDLGKVRDYYGTPRHFLYYYYCYSLWKLFQKQFQDSFAKLTSAK